MINGVGARGLSGWQKFFLSFPTMPGNLSVVLIHNAFIKYYTDIIGLDPKFVGLIYSVFGIWNAVNDPAIGVWLDRRKYSDTKGKYVHIMKMVTPVTLFSSFAMIFFVTPMILFMISSSDNPRVI
jgi:GPH family glycoside/pentoside/hexuronide:cation symporter